MKIKNNDVLKNDSKFEFLPTDIQQMPGESEQISWGVFPLMDKDVLYVRSDGGGGYGDPVEREPEEIANDVRSGTVTRHVAEDVYGVVIDQSGTIDEKATSSARKTIKNLRLRKRS